MEPSTHIGATPWPTSAPLSVVPAACNDTLGLRLALRLVEIGVHDVFFVPSNFNLTLLDHLIGACVVTFTVGGLIVLNAIAGACSENLPVIYIVSGRDQLQESNS